MRKRFLPLVASIALSLSVSACTIQARPAVAHHNHHAGAKIVVVKKGHVHSRHCGHYRYKSNWYYLQGHVHGPRCGHTLVRGVWVFRR